MCVSECQCMQATWGDWRGWRQRQCIPRAGMTGSWELPGIGAQRGTGSLQDQCALRPPSLLSSSNTGLIFILLSFIILLIKYCWDRASLCNPGWPETPRDPPTTAPSAGVTGEYPALSGWFCSSEVLGLSVGRNDAKKAGWARGAVGHLRDLAQISLFVFQTVVLPGQFFLKNLLWLHKLTRY
jgi:hypothetical protein